MTFSFPSLPLDPLASPGTPGAPLAATPTGNPAATPVAFDALLGAATPVEAAVSGVRRDGGQAEGGTGLLASVQKPGSALPGGDASVVQTTPALRAGPTAEEGGLSRSAAVLPVEEQGREVQSLRGGIEIDRTGGPRQHDDLLEGASRPHRRVPSKALSSTSEEPAPVDVDDRSHREKHHETRAAPGMTTGAVGVIAPVPCTSAVPPTAGGKGECSVSNTYGAGDSATLGQGRQSQRSANTSAAQSGPAIAQTVASSTPAPVAGGAQANVLLQPEPSVARNPRAGTAHPKPAAPLKVAAPEETATASPAVSKGMAPAESSQAAGPLSRGSAPAADASPLAASRTPRAVAAQAPAVSTSAPSVISGPPAVAAPTKDVTDPSVASGLEASPSTRPQALPAVNGRAGFTALDVRLEGRPGSSPTPHDQMLRPDPVVRASLPAPAGTMPAPATVETSNPAFPVPPTLRGIAVDRPTPPATVSRFNPTAEPTAALSGTPSRTIPVSLGLTDARSFTMPAHAELPKPDGYGEQAGQRIGEIASGTGATIPTTANGEMTAGTPGLIRAGNVLANAGGVARPQGTTLAPATAKAAGEGPEKFASVSERTRGTVSAPRTATIKQAVTTEREDLTKQASVFGISGAKSQAAMSSPSSPDTLPLPEVAPAEAAGASRNGVERAHPAAAAERAVEAVMEVADRASTRERSSVTLQFDLHGTPLDVRVVMRGGEVQTTFHTNSPELRAALQSEWTAVTESLPQERVQQFTAPVFASSESAATATGGGDAGARQRQFEAPVERPGASTPTRNSPETPSETPTVRQPAYAATAHHLHTLA